LSGKTAQKFADASTGTVFANGTKRIAAWDFVFVVYAKGDIAKEFPDGAVAYRYAGTSAVEATLGDGTVFRAFANGQREKHAPGGEKMGSTQTARYGVTTRTVPGNCTMRTGLLIDNTGSALADIDMEEHIDGRFREFDSQLFRSGFLGGNPKSSKQIQFSV
jgi:hypothetical protein